MISEVPSNPQLTLANFMRDMLFYADIFVTHLVFQNSLEKLTIHNLSGGKLKTSFENLLLSIIEMFSIVIIEKHHENIF